MTTTEVMALVQDQLCMEHPPQPHHRLVEDLGADSLDRAELIVRLESATGRTISDDQADAARTVADLCKIAEAV